MLTLTFFYHRLLQQDYSWEDHGFSLVNRLYSDVGFLLDDKFRTAYHLTYQTMGAFRPVDTRLFRRAVWRYIQCLYGIRLVMWKLMWDGVEWGGMGRNETGPEMGRDGKMLC